MVANHFTTSDRIKLFKNTKYIACQWITHGECLTEKDPAARTLALRGAIAIVPALGRTTRQCGARLAGIVQHVVYLKESDRNLA